MTNRSLQENASVIPNWKREKIWLKCSLSHSSTAFSYSKNVQHSDPVSLLITLGLPFGTDEHSGSWKRPSLLPDPALPLSVHRRVLNGQSPSRWAGRRRPHPLPRPRVSRESSAFCNHHRRLPWARGWRGRAGCPGWIVRRPWRCKDRRCCCCSCCICKSCCWKANCWVATCCCWKKSGRKKKKKNEMATAGGRWNVWTFPNTLSPAGTESAH